MQDKLHFPWWLCDLVDRVSSALVAALTSEYTVCLVDTL